MVGHSDYYMNPFKVLVEFDFTHATQIISLSGIFEGKFRTAISNQIEYGQIIAFRIEFDALLRQWRTRSGKLRAPAGHYQAESRIVIGKNCPGSYYSKNGSIEYLIAVKLRTAGRFGNSEQVQVRPVTVHPLVDITRFLSFRMPIHVEKFFHKKVFCFNKSSAKILVKLSKAAYVRGEEIAVWGELGNEHATNPIKGGLVELVMVARFRCKGNEKFSKETLSYFALPAVPACSITAFEHHLEVPIDAFPTYSQPDALINSAYHISITINECPAIEIPLIIGTGQPARPVSVSQRQQLPLLALTGDAKTRPLLPRFPHQQFSKPSIDRGRILLPPHLLPLQPPPPSPTYFSDQLCRSQFFLSHPLPFHNRHPHSESQMIFPQKEPITTRYKGQSVLRIEEIE